VTEIRNLEPHPGTGVISYQVRRNGIMKGDLEQEKIVERLRDKQSETLNQCEPEECGETSEATDLEESPNVALVRKWLAEMEEEERLARGAQTTEGQEESLDEDDRELREIEKRFAAKGMKFGCLD